MKFFIIAANLTLAIVFSGCSIIESILPHPDQFVLNRWNFAAQMLYVQNMSPIDSVEQTADNTLLLHSGSTAAIAADRLTDFAADFSITITRGTGVRLATRTVEHFYKEEKGIAFVYTTSGSFIEENEREVARIDSVRAIIGQQARIFIINEGKKYRVQVGCNVVYRGETSLPSTEYVIAQPLAASKVELAGIDFIPVRIGRPTDWNREKPWGKENGVQEVLNARPKSRR